MKVHLKQIPAEGLILEGEEDSSVLDLHDVPGTGVRAITGIRYRLDIGLSEGGLFAVGTLAIDLEFECVRCLEKFVYPLNIDDFALQMELPGTEMIDLTPEVREDILLALPAYPHCDWDGSRQCPGTAVAALSDEGKTRDILTETAPASTWDALKQLQIRPRS